MWIDIPNWRISEYLIRANVSLTPVSRNSYGERDLTPELFFFSRKVLNKERSHKKHKKKIHITFGPAENFCDFPAPFVSSQDLFSGFPLQKLWTPAETT